MFSTEERLAIYLHISEDQCNGHSCPLLADCVEKGAAVAVREHE